MTLKELKEKYNYIEDIINILYEKSNIVFSYIFGSYAKGENRESSDIDIAIYLKNNQISTDKYLSLLYDIMSISNKKVDLVILNDSPPLIKHEVYTEGILLFTKDKETLTNYKVKTLFEYEDMKYYLNMQYKDMINRIREERANDG
ncbi:type VII toxin-antitoxin system MntA family adenylyltransferase antitoxin [Clostridiisalibacter paucivorans]|uniref:type VII toxin-antitoxin system MntA family adenylyltransferase antitoxin n=1 Tax=Clostridiisalibacter paucivorans TaxID=408753 RepID=UPI0006851C71|nr:nucleotidyltransferase domain-containing protein [Clostridiisalibacter paucivorans]